MKFKQTDCTFRFENIVAEISNILKESNHYCDQFIVRRFQSPLVYMYINRKNKNSCVSADIPKTGYGR